MGDGKEFFHGGNGEDKGKKKEKREKKEFFLIGFFIKKGGEGEKESGAKRGSKGEEGKRR